MKTNNDNDPWEERDDVPTPEEEDKMGCTISVIIAIVSTILAALKCCG